MRDLQHRARPTARDAHTPPRRSSPPMHPHQTNACMQNVFPPHPTRPVRVSPTSDVHARSSCPGPLRPRDTSPSRIIRMCGRAAYVACGLTSGWYRVTTRALCARAGAKGDWLRHPWPLASGTLSMNSWNSWIT
ncbi:uncharacterized protein LAESUDRAFT_516933 [Laetiporus sulphureus 93-53]|uniref:Uncharacterized protein n=1 Tax=Laetiporus sulphureus 93-53 TaxID=1314785 RepID=A0A165G1D2_9APHY|nr:uncharacterized protein LAESUDRAFT_516933 [Laetiporus sulphureus 93-53]KZT09698.1 hypothetical protein LAESUDRAFT_516933 [Laetiporus sulphureus 93-53]